MKDCIAERNLVAIQKKSGVRAELSIKIGRPYIVQVGSVSFQVGGDTAACEIEILGLCDPIKEIIYGVDLVHALQIASDFDSILKGFAKSYDLYFKDGADSTLKCITN